MILMLIGFLTGLAATYMVVPASTEISQYEQEKIYQRIKEEVYSK